MPIVHRTVRAIARRHSIRPAVHHRPSSILPVRTNFIGARAPASRHEFHWQLRKGSDTETLAPHHLLRLSVEAYVGKARKDAFKCDCGLRPSELEPKAEMYARTEGEVGLGCRLMSGGPTAWQRLRHMFEQPLRER